MSFYLRRCDDVPSILSQTNIKANSEQRKLTAESAWIGFAKPLGGIVVYDSPENLAP